jgi:hypothetical protein
VLIYEKKIMFGGEFQLYGRIINVKINVKIYAERCKLVDEPKEYYTIISLIDTIEFIYRIHKKRMIDKELWQRWENHAKSMMTIPKFKKVWNATKEFHTQDFGSFMDSL